MARQPPPPSRSRDTARNAPPAPLRAPPLRARNSNGDRNDRGRAGPFGGKKAAPFNNRKPRGRGK